MRQYHFKTDTTATEEKQYSTENDAIRDAMMEAGKSEAEIELVLNNPRLRAAKLLSGKAGKQPEVETARDARSNSHGLTNGKVFGTTQTSSNLDSASQAKLDAAKELGRTEALAELYRTTG